MNNSFKYRIIYTVVELSLGLVALELVLRLLGFGYNLIYRLPKDTNADYRIFCVGESTTWGTGTKNPLTENYPKQLENMLNKQFPDKKIICFFDQTIGQNSSEILLKLSSYIKKYRPQIIILMVGVNNWWNIDRSNILLFNKNNYISNISLKTLIFLDKFRVWKLFKWARLSLGLYKERWNYWFPESESEKDLKDRISILYGKEIWRIFSELAEYDISEMVKICKANDIKVIICSYPMYAIGDLCAVQKKISEKFNIPFVDNYAFFSKLPNLQDYLWQDGWHPNEKGYRLVAKNIYNYIVENKLIE